MIAQWAAVEGTEGIDEEGEEGENEEVEMGGVE